MYSRDEVPDLSEPAGDESRVLVVVSYHPDTSHYPRSGRREDRRTTYWTNIATNAATLRHVHGDGPAFVVFAGDEPPSEAADVLREAQVEIRHLDFARRPPEDFYYRYVGSLYVLDVMAALADEVADDDVVLFVDPDVVWMAPIDPLVADVRTGGVVAYHLDVPDTVPMCHLSRRAQGEVLTEITGHGPPADGPAYLHFGGELYGMLGAELRSILPELDRLWEATMSRYEQGLPHYNVEEHLMNGVLWQRGEQLGRANRYIARIITSPSPRGSRERARPGLVAWHLPIEKDRGLMRIFRRITSRRPLPPPGRAYERWVGHRVGVRPTPARWLTDRGRKLKWATIDRRDTPTYGI
jgi:hypothetical protein